MIIHMLHLQIVPYFLYVRQILMICLNKAIVLNLTQKLLNQVFQIIFTHLL